VACNLLLLSALRFLSEEIEEARASGRDPVAMDQEAGALRSEQTSLQTKLQEHQSSLDSVTAGLRELEVLLTTEENQVSAALRAIADQREGTARQEGHINGLRSRIDATNAEITRLTTARDEALSRLQQFKSDFALLESEIAGLDASEPDLDAQHERAKSAMQVAIAEFNSSQEREQIAQRERSGLTSRLAALEESLLHRDGGEAIMSGRSGAQVRGRLSALITVESGWEAAVGAALALLQIRSLLLICVQLLVH